MGKVVTSAGLNEFVTSGKHETVENHKAVAKAEPLPVKVETPVVDLKPDIKPDIKPDDDGLEADDIDLTEHVRKKIGKKHRAMKEAQEKAEEAERFAENQYNRATLAERKAAEIEAENARLKIEKQPAKVEEKEPDENDPQFKDGNEFNWRKFTKAQADYAATKAVAEALAKQETQRRADAAAELDRVAERRLVESEKEHPDLRQKLDSTPVQTHKSVLAYISASTQIGDLTYHLLTNPDFVERINKLDPWSARDAVVELATTLKKPVAAAQEVKVTPGAPPPIVPLPSQAVVNTNTDPAKMSYKELRAYERARRKH